MKRPSLAHQITALLAFARETYSPVSVSTGSRPLADEVRHLHTRPVLGGGALQDVGDGRALEPRGRVSTIFRSIVFAGSRPSFPLRELDLDAGVGTKGT